MDVRTLVGPTALGTDAPTRARDVQPTFVDTPIVGSAKRDKSGKLLLTTWPGTGVEVLPRSGDVLHITTAASVQFIEPLLFRVIRVLDWPTYSGWVWLDGYELNHAGDAVERRSIFVQVDGLQTANVGPWGRTDAIRTGRRGPAIERRSGPRNRGRQALG